MQCQCLQSCCGNKMRVPAALTYFAALPINVALQVDWGKVFFCCFFFFAFRFCFVYFATKDTRFHWKHLWSISFIESSNNKRESKLVDKTPRSQITDLCRQETHRPPENQSFDKSTNLWRTQTGETWVWRTHNFSPSGQAWLHGPFCDVLSWGSGGQPRERRGGNFCHVIMWWWGGGG